MNLALLVPALLTAVPTLIPDPNQAPPPSDQSAPSQDARAHVEVLAGVAGEIVMILPAMYIGFAISDAMADTSACAGVSDRNRRAECIESAQYGAHGAGLAVGASLGVGLGSGLGVVLAGTLMHANGGTLPALLAGLAGGALGIILPGGPLASAGLGLVGAVIAYEVTAPRAAAPAPSRPPAEHPRTDYLFTPTLAITPGGGMLGISGRF